MGHKATYIGPAHALAMMRPDDLHRGITNLVENAVRFGSEATIRLDAAEDRIVIDIADNGPGILDADKRQVLEPFVRGDDARNMDNAAGFGLGLSIARAIASAHGGELSLHDSQPRGLIVRGSNCRDCSRQGRPPERLMSGRERRRFHLPFVEDGNRLEAIIAGAAVPEIGDAALALLHPVRRRNRLAALGTWISTRQTAEIKSRHGALPQNSF
jgi:Histidine kinase-, DNA gyrase B-, and HSP90-like ATPase